MKRRSRNLKERKKKKNLLIEPQISVEPQCQLENQTNQKAFNKIYRDLAQPESFTEKIKNYLKKNVTHSLVSTECLSTILKDIRVSTKLLYNKKKCTINLLHHLEVALRAPCPVAPNTFFEGVGVSTKCSNTKYTFFEGVRVSTKCSSTKHHLGVTPTRNCQKLPLTTILLLLRSYQMINSPKKERMKFDKIINSNLQENSESDSVLMGLFQQLAFRCFSIVKNTAIM